MDSGLGQHGVVLELRLAKRRSVARDDDELGLARADGLLLKVLDNCELKISSNTDVTHDGRLVSQGDCAPLE